VLLEKQQEKIDKILAAIKSYEQAIQSAINNQTTNVQQSNQTVALQEKVDDRPAYLRKQNG
jgi:hypothetical protein